MLTILKRCREIIQNCGGIYYIPDRDELLTALDKAIEEYGELNIVMVPRKHFGLWNVQILHNGTTILRSKDMEGKHAETLYLFLDGKMLRVKDAE